jgi:magnesium-transporting ATPase (P-type)
VSVSAPDRAPAVGLTEQEARRRLQAAGGARPEPSSRSYASIVRANVFTLFNVILAAFGVVTLVFGDPRDALFLTVVVANSGIGIFQEVRAKHALDRLALLVAPRDVVAVQAGDQVVADGRLIAATGLHQEGRRVVALGRSAAALDGEPGPRPPADTETLGLVVLAERLRPQIRETVAFFRAQDVELKVFSGDNPETVAAIASDVGIPVRAVAEGSSLPEAGDELTRQALDTSVIGRVSPADKRHLVGAARGRALRGHGRRLRQRRTRAQGLAAGHRAGQRRPDGQERGRSRAGRRRLRRGSRARGPGAPGAATSSGWRACTSPSRPSRPS